MLDPSVHARHPHIDELRCLVHEFVFAMEEVPGIPIKVKVWKSSRSYGGDQFTYTVSHYIHTPTQIGPYVPGAPFSDRADRIARKAIRSIVSYYDEAIKTGHTPSAKWFVPNEDFY